MSDGTPPGYISDENMVDGNDGAHDDADKTGEEIYHPLDPLDPRKVSLDIFEMYCHEMIYTPTIGRRAYLIQKMKYLMARLIGNQYPYGRLYNHTCIANITSRICARQPYSVDDMSDADEGHNYCLADCLVDFTHEKWKKIIAQFEDVRESLLRKDAALLVLPAELGAGSEETESELPSEDESVNQSLASSGEFTKEYKEMLDTMKFHMCLSHIQPHLDNAIQKIHSDSSADDDAVVIPYDDIMVFNNEIQQAFDGDEKCKHFEILKSLLMTKKKGRNRHLQLKSFDVIKGIYDDNEELFDLGRFQKTFLSLIRRWSELALPVAELVKLRYGSTTPAAGLDNKENVSSLGSAFATKPTKQEHQQKKRRIDSAASNAAEEEEEADDGEKDGEEEKEGNLDRLKRTRETLMNNVKDPLYECVEQAESARRRPESQAYHANANTGSESTVSTPSFRKKKKSTYKIVFSDSEDEDDNAAGNAGQDKVETDDLEDSVEEDKGVKLSELPKKAKVDTAPKKISVSVAAKPKQGKRKRFTESEDAAIRNGVERFGEGRWADIKSYYHIDLADRSSVQIKDRWRTLNK